MIGWAILLPWLVVGQFTKENVFHQLPKEYKFKLRTKDFYRISEKNKKLPLGEKIVLGCSPFEKEGIPIAFMFSMRERKGKNKLQMHLYVIQRINYIEDEKIINALDYYCYYGQHNYYFMSKDYLVFTYSRAGDALANKDLDKMALVENQLVKNLNALGQ